MELTVEICVDSVDSAIAAQAGGAHRVELCDNLMEGGTTPSAGAIRIARERLTIGLQVIIRPRGGDFLYNEIEFEIMKHDIETAKALGADGVVIGLLQSDGSVDVDRTKRLVELARPMSVTFHRAFDVAREPFAAMEAIISCGVDRLLTSGQEATAIEGAELIGELVGRAGDRLTIMGCGNLNERNLSRFISQTGVHEVHFTAFGTEPSAMEFRNDRVFMGGTLRPPEYERNVTRAEIVERMIGGKVRK